MRERQNGAEPEDVNIAWGVLNNTGYSLKDDASIAAAQTLYDRAPKAEGVGVPLEADGMTVFIPGAMIIWSEKGPLLVLPHEQEQNKGGRNGKK